MEIGLEVLPKITLSLGQEFEPSLLAQCDQIYTSKLQGVQTIIYHSNSSRIEVKLITGVIVGIKLSNSPLNSIYVPSPTDKPSQILEHVLQAISTKYNIPINSITTKMFNASSNDIILTIANPNKAHYYKSIQIGLVLSPTKTINIYSLKISIPSDTLQKRDKQ